MTDYELQKIVLRKYFDLRKSEMKTVLTPDNFDFDINMSEIDRINAILLQQDFITGMWAEQAIQYGSTRTSGNHFRGTITSKGIALIEEKSLEGNIPQLSNINIHNSENIQIGNHNIMNIEDKIEIQYNELVEKIMQSNASQEKKSKVLKFLNQLKNDANFFGIEFIKMVFERLLTKPIDGLITKITDLLS
ncbi:MAG TPA: RIP homotypic interaction motif-containing protein [Candidatus Kapabacteria bacterium]|jgi:hypothetical protein|nr:RIP homotypic interaction motif-containing protein [Candidatus Kapabacteria bacterium]